MFHPAASRAPLTPASTQARAGEEVRREDRPEVPEGRRLNRDPQQGMSLFSPSQNVKLTPACFSGPDYQARPEEEAHRLNRQAEDRQLGKSELCFPPHISHSSWTVI